MKKEIEKEKVLNEIATEFIKSIENKFYEESIFILNDLLKKSVISNLINTEVDTEIEELLGNHSQIIQAYEEAPNYRVKRQILSLLPNKYSKSTIMNAFGISKWLVDAARKHSNNFGAGMIVSSEPIFRERLDPIKVEFFLDFITTDNYLQDVAYGSRSLKINDIYSISMPNVVRLASHRQIIIDYMKICEEVKTKPISERVCYKILKECSASYSKSLQGLDNTYADGLDAFDKLEEILRLFSDSDIIKNLSCILKSSKNYLKFSYKNHLSFSNECTDHCVTFALSDEKTCCGHTHSRSCYECNTLDHVINEIKKELEKLSGNQKTETLFDFNLANEKIYNWKYHLLRNWCQDQIKYTAMNQLDRNSVFVHFDWAMKKLPSKSREKQEDWFGKRGISWHVAVVVFLENDVLKTLKFVHTFKSTSQDSDSIIGITNSVFEQIFLQLGPKSIFFRADNAGCYHNQSLICLMPFFASKHHHILKRLDFCEPQTGKDICDRIIAQVKRYLNTYVEQGNDILNANDIKKAIDSSSSLEGLQCFVCEDSENIDFKKDASFKNITYYHSFEYFCDHFNAFKYYNVGQGIKMMFKDTIKQNQTALIKKVKNSSLEIVDSGRLTNYEHLKSKNNNLSLFKCKLDGCLYSTSDKNELKEHYGTHESNLSQHSKIKLEYAKRCSDIRTNNTNIETIYKEKNQNLINSQNSDLAQGYALKK